MIRHRPRCIADIAHWKAFEFEGYEDHTIDGQWWTGQEFKVIDWLEHFEGKGRFHFDTSFGLFRFEHEEDLAMFILRFGKDIRYV